ncbi:MAG: hypothetical protein JXB24_10270 [Bacteroidales bacterium]|nr:hypothetical protein [Bacteroidales bacterium]
METTTNSIQNQPENKPSVILVVIVIVLAIATIILGYKYYQESKQLTQTSEEKAILEDVKSDLEKQLRNMIVEYDSLKTNNDSVNILLVQEQEKITRLLRMQASDAEKIRKYQSELETLRKVMRNYIVQIDSLNTRNIQLTEENIQVRQQLTSIEEQNIALASEKELLSTQVELASVLSAKNIVVEPEKSRNRSTDKIRNLEQIKVCFTVRENAIAEAGPKDIYLRIIRPDEVVLPNDEGSTFEFNGEQVVYSAQRELEYENNDIDMCIFWTKNTDLIAGNYTVILYAESFEIGSSSFSLK